MDNVGYAFKNRDPWRIIMSFTVTLEAIQEGLDRANDINAIGYPRHLISEMIKEKKMFIGSF